MYSLILTYLSDKENSNVQGRAGGLACSTRAAGASNKSVKMKGAGCGRGGSELATSRPTGRDHAGISDDSGKSLLHICTHIHAYAHTHIHTHAHTCTHTHSVSEST